MLWMYDSNNIFAKILRKELESEILVENEKNIVIKDKYPKTPIHNLVIPKGEYIDFADFAENANNEEIISFVKTIGVELKKLEDGGKVVFNYKHGGGQRIFHLHAHILAGMDPEEII